MAVLFLLLLLLVCLATSDLSRAASVPGPYVILNRAGTRDTWRSVPAWERTDTPLPHASVVTADDIYVPTYAAMCQSLVVDVTLLLARNTWEARARLPTSASLWLFPDSAVSPGGRPFIDRSAIMHVVYNQPSDGPWDVRTDGEEVLPGTRSGVAYHIQRYRFEVPGVSLLGGSTYWVALSLACDRAYNSTDYSQNQPRWMLRRAADVTAPLGPARVDPPYHVVDRYGSMFRQSPSLAAWTAAASASPVVLSFPMGPVAPAGDTSTESNQLDMAAYAGRCINVSEIPSDAFLTSLPPTWPPRHATPSVTPTPTQPPPPTVATPTPAVPTPLVTTTPTPAPVPTPSVTTPTVAIPTPAATPSAIPGATPVGESPTPPATAAVVTPTSVPVAHDDANVSTSAVMPATPTGTGTIPGTPSTSTSSTWPTPTAREGGSNVSASTRTGNGIADLPEWARNLVIIGSVLVGTCIVVAVVIGAAVIVGRRRKFRNMRYSEIAGEMNGIELDSTSYDSRDDSDSDGGRGALAAASAALRTTSTTMSAMMEPMNDTEIGDMNAPYSVMLGSDDDDDADGDADSVAYDNDTMRTVDLSDERGM